MFFRAGALLSLGIALAHTAHAQKIPPNVTGYSGHKILLTPELRAQIGEVLSKASVPGYSLAFVSIDGHVEYGNWGVRTEEGDLMTSDTQFVLASVSKQFTATALGLIIDDYAHGRNVTPLPSGLQDLDWDTKLKDILPEDWGLMDPWASEKANLHDVLSHVSGLPRHDVAYKVNDTPLDRVRLLRHLRPAYELREQWHYSNHMYILASHLVSVLSNSTFNSFLHRRIFTPLNMTSSTVDPMQASQKMTHAWAGTSPVNRRVPELFTPSEANLLAGAGAIMSSVEDMAEWLSVLLQAQQEDEDGDGPIPSSIIKETMRPQSIIGLPLSAIPGFDFGRTTYGKEWTQQNYRGHRHVEHDGSSIGYSTLISLYPDDGFGIIQLANTIGKAAENIEISLLIADAALGLKSLQPPEPASSVDPFPSVDIVKPAPSSFVKRISHARSLTGNPLKWPLKTFARTYTDPGYGSLTLCTSDSTSAHCRGVLSAFSSLSPNGKVDENCLYADWPSIFVSHVRFVPLEASNDTAMTTANEDNVAYFELQGTKIYPEGHGANKTAFEISAASAGVKAEFVVGESDRVVGMGWTGLEGEVLGPAGKSNSVKDKAEVWFTADPSASLPSCCTSPQFH